MRRPMAVAAATLAVAVIVDTPGAPRAGDGSTHSLRLAHRPYVGVACRVPNSIACDRLGLAVYLPKSSPAARVQAWVDHRAVRMRIPEGVPTKGVYFEGFLLHAGLDRRFRAAGECGAFVRVRIRAFYRDGGSGTRTLRLAIAPGWG